jgi:hypothetical protein
MQGDDALPENLSSKYMRPIKERSGHILTPGHVSKNLRYFFPVVDPAELTLVIANRSSRAGTHG